MFSKNLKFLVMTKLSFYFSFMDHNFAVKSNISSISLSAWKCSVYPSFSKLYSLTFYICDKFWVNLYVICESTINTYNDLINLNGIMQNKKKGRIFKGHILCNSINVTFLNWQNYRDAKKISGCHKVKANRWRKRKIELLKRILVVME